MSKAKCKEKMDQYLRDALKAYHATSGITQEKLAERLCISPRACSALENGENGFSAFSVIALFSLLSMSERLSLLVKLCKVVCRTSGKAA